MTDRNPLRALLLQSCVAALLLCGCSTFNYEWRQAVRKPIPTNSITGRWEGRWISQANGHNDQLRCLITQVDESHYDARFHAAYKTWITFHFSYNARLETRPGTNGVTFHGTADLGLLAGGVYTYKGLADTTNFFSTYDSKYDRGVFQMHRPAPAP